MTYIYGALADLIVVVHFAYVATVVGGLLLILIGIPLRWQWIRNPWFRYLHLLMILVVAAEALGSITCPLTDWEYALRDAAGQSAPTDTFVGRTIRTLFFFDATQFTGLLAVLDWVFAGLTLATFVLAPPRFRRRTKDLPSATDTKKHDDDPERAGTNVLSA